MMGMRSALSYWSSGKRDVSLCSQPPILTSWSIFTACKIFCLSHTVSLQCSKITLFQLQRGRKAWEKQDDHQYLYHLPTKCVNSTKTLLHDDAAASSSYAESIDSSDPDIMHMCLLRYDIQQDFASATITPLTFNLTCYKCYHAANSYNAVPIRPSTVRRPTVLFLAFGKYLEKSRVELL